MSGNTITLHSGSIEEMGKRFIGAWNGALAGDAKEISRITILDLESFATALTPRRLELLKALRSNGPSSVRALAFALKRDYKSVHRDVELLIGAGLVTRTARDQVAVGWDKIVAEIDLAAA